ncbi:MAG: DinB family protein [Candidatus Acidiferrales bacterium]
MPTKDDVLTEFDVEMANTRKVLERVPDDKFSWKPHDKSGSMGWLANHVATLPEFATTILQSDSHDFDGQTRPKQSESRKELLDAFDKNIRVTRAEMEKLSDAALQKPWTLSYKGQTIFTMPRGAALRSPFMNHLIHHRAQLGVYLRLNNVPLPSLYGPTADEPWQPS